MQGRWSQDRSCASNPADALYSADRVDGGEGAGAFRAEISAEGDPATRLTIHVLRVLSGSALKPGDSITVRRDGVKIRLIQEIHGGEQTDYEADGPVWFLCDP